jgi:hypothetical protein
LKTHDLTPDQYRQRYGLKPDYPMVAPAYSEARRAMALKIGLGGRAAAARAAAAASQPAPEAAPPGRKKAIAAQKPARSRGVPKAPAGGEGEPAS